MATVDLNELVDQVTKSFDQCLSNALGDSTVAKEQQRGSSDISVLKSTFLELEHQLKDIRLECIQENQLNITESIALLERDITIKQKTIDKYMGQLDNWITVLPELEQKSLTILNATADIPTDTLTTTSNDNTATNDIMNDRPIDGTNSNSNDNNNDNDNDNDSNDDDDDDDDIEFEEV